MRKDSDSDVDAEHPGEPEAAGDNHVDNVPIKIEEGGQLKAEFKTSDIDFNKTGREVKEDLLKNAEVPGHIQNKPECCRLYYKANVDSTCEPILIDEKEVLTNDQLAGPNSCLIINATGIPPVPDDHDPNYNLTLKPNGNNI